jgi:hypothetical protein
MKNVIKNNEDTCEIEYVLYKYEEYMVTLEAKFVEYEDVKREMWIVVRKGGNVIYKNSITCIHVRLNDYKAEDVMKKTEEEFWKEGTPSNIKLDPKEDRFAFFSFCDGVYENFEYILEGIDVAGVMNARLLSFFYRALAEIPKIRKILVSRILENVHLKFIPFSLERKEVLNNLKCFVPYMETNVEMVFSFLEGGSYVETKGPKGNNKEIDSEEQDYIVEVGGIQLLAVIWGGMYRFNRKIKVEYLKEMLKDSRLEWLRRRLIALPYFNREWYGKYLLKYVPISRYYDLRMGDLKRINKYKRNWVLKNVERLSDTMVKFAVLHGSPVNIRALCKWYWDDDIRVMLKDKKIKVYVPARIDTYKFFLNGSGTLEDAIIRLYEGLGDLMELMFPYFIKKGKRIYNMGMLSEFAKKWMKTSSVNTKMAVEKHVKAKSVYFLKMDVKNFYNSITAETLRMCGLNEKLVLMATLPTFKRVEYGNPYSAVVAEEITRRCLEGLEERLGKQGMVVSMYVDDILVSSKKRFDIHDVVEVVEQVIGKYGLKLNEEKIKFKVGSIDYLGLHIRKGGYQIPLERKFMLMKKYFAWMPPALWKELKKNGTLPKEKCYKIQAKKYGRRRGILGYFKFHEPKFYKKLVLHLRRKQIRLDVLFGSKQTQM